MLRTKFVGLRFFFNLKGSDVGWTAKRRLEIGEEISFPIADLQKISITYLQN